MIYQLTSLLIGLILPKYFTEIFGSVYNGLNQTVSQIMSLLSVLQLGISAVSIQQMFKYIATDNKAMLTSVYRETERKYRQMGFVFLTVLVPIIIVFPMLIRENISYKIAVAFLLFRSISSAMEYFFQAKYSVVLIAHNKSYLIYALNTLLLVIGTALNLTILFTVKNILIYQAVSVLVSLLRMIIVGGYISWKFPFLLLKSTVEYHETPDSRRRDVLVSEIAGVVIESTDILVLSIFSGLVSASIYSVYNFVTTGLGNVLSSCREAVFASIGQTYYSDFEEFKNKMDRFESIYIFLVFFLYMNAILLFKPFITVYTSNMDTQYIFAGFPILFVLAKIAVNLRIPSIVAINTAGHFAQVKHYAVIEAAINLIISLLLVKPLGIYGVLIGTISGAIFRTPVLTYYANKNIMKRRTIEFWKKSFIWLPMFLACYLTSILWPIECFSLLHWVEVSALVAGIVLVISLIWMRIFDRRTSDELKTIVTKLFRKKGE